MEAVEKQKEIIDLMIELYCSKNHSHKNSICQQCNELLDYALNRLDNCKYGNSKGFCRGCDTPCYRPDMRREIKKVMRFSGPRLMLYRPVECIRHIFR